MTNYYCKGKEIETYEGRINAEQEEQQFQEHLVTIRKFKKSFYDKYEKLSNGNSYADSAAIFREEIKPIISRIEAMEGPLYSEEGKKAAIQDEIQKMASKHTEKIRKHAEDANETLRGLLDGIEEELVRQSQLSPEDAKRIQLRNSELQAEVQSRLSLMYNGRAIGTYFYDLLEKGDKDKDLARFLSKHYYLFIQRIREADKTGNAAIDIARISSGAQEAEKKGYSPNYLALTALKEKMKDNFYAGSTTLIDMAVNGLKRKYQ